MKPWILLVCFPFFLSATTTAEKVNFHQGSFTTAKSKAAQEGKLIFVDFVASWCMPCRWMDETTFTDPKLANYVKDNYVAVKIDIDDFDGFAYKQQYNIRLLPTILVFNSKGKLLAKIEESLPPTRMLEILKKYDKPQNRVRTAAPPAPNIGSASTSNHNTGEIKRNPLPTTQPTSSSTSTTTTNAGSSISSAATGSAASIASGDGLYRFKVSRQASNGFSVQIGAFGEYGNVLREVSKLQDRFDQPIIVHIANLKGKTVYKILIGEFSTRNAAIDYRDGLKTKGVNGIIKDMSTMK